MLSMGLQKRNSKGVTMSKLVVITEVTKEDAFYESRNEIVGGVFKTSDHYLDVLRDDGSRSMHHAKVVKCDFLYGDTVSFYSVKVRDITSFEDHLSYQMELIGIAWNWNGKNVKFATKDGNRLGRRKFKDVMTKCIKSMTSTMQAQRD
jgi:hypothetical protein